jgi:geranylgeranyl reductase family protein
MQKQWDVIVVGAGPGGSQTARYLASRKRSVLVLEEHEQVGLPVHCSGFVTPRTLEEANVTQDIVLNAVKGAHVFGPKDATLVLGGDRIHAYVVDRAGLDRSVAAAAQDAGAEVRLGARALAVERSAGGVAVRVRHKGTEEEIRARMVVGADGVRSVVRTWVGAALSEQIWCAGAEVRLPGHPKDMVRLYIGRDVAPDWFGWTIPMGDGRVRLGVGTRMVPGGTKPRHLLDTIFARHPDHFRNMEVLAPSGGYIPLYGRVQTYADRALLVGDAALQVKGTSGGGIYMSLAAARHAADIADGGLESDDLSAARLAPYDARWRRAFGVELERGSIMRGAAVRLSDAQIARLMRFLDQPVMRSVLNRYGDIDFPSPMFGRLFSAFPMLLRVLRLPKALPGSWKG